jgi:ATP-dependent helicase/nuclease subunit A
MNSDLEPSVVASDPRSSAWVAANAGSGKTYTLANRVTRLLLDDARPEKILCLTFTKAAAAEMQHRLFDVLGELAMLPDGALLDRLAEITGDEFPTDDPTKARRMFALALEAPGGLKIQTIHAFCQGVLARFPLEAGIPPGFRVLDEQSAAMLMEEARERVLQRAGTGEALLSSALAMLVTQVSDERVNKILRTAVGTDRRKLERFLNSLDPSPDSLEQALRTAHGQEKNETEASIVATFCAAAKMEAARLHEVIGWLAGGYKSDREKGRRLAEALDLEIPKHAYVAFSHAMLKRNGERFRSLVTHGLAARNPELLDFLEQFVERLCLTEAQRRAAHAAELCHAMLVVAAAVLKTYSSAKRSRGVLDYDDLIVETKRLLERRRAAQWVLFKLDGGLDHILIDEAQDTSPEQWAIVSKLSEEFFAGSGTRDDSMNPTIFAVGDEKQSIFSFQGADPALFESFRGYFEQRAFAAECSFVSQPLLASRRSAPEILQFVDCVFASSAASDGLTSSRHSITHVAHRSEAEGRVEFWPALRPTTGPEPDPLREVDLPSQASPISSLCRRIAAQIREWIDCGVRLPSRNRPIVPGDIMILLPRREPFAAPIIQALKDQRIPVSGADRMRLTDHIAVKDLIALGRFALLPEDDLTTAELLRSPFCGVDEDALLAVCHGRSGTVWNELRRRAGERPEFNTAYEYLSDMLGRADFSPPFEFYTHALATRDARRRFLARLGPEADDAIGEFLSLALTFDSGNTPSLDGFLHWLERGGAEIKRDMGRGRDEIRVMTVHGAKGLEADIVILPDTTTLPQAPSQQGHLLYESNGVLFPVVDAQQPSAVSHAATAAHEAVLREHRRLLYVAMTRARDRLYICGAENKQGIKDGSWYRLAEAAAMSMGAKVSRYGDTIRVIGDPDELEGSALQSDERWTATPQWAVVAPGPVTKVATVRPFDSTHSVDSISARSRDLSGIPQVRRGILIHAMLAGLPGVAAHERLAAATRYLLRQRVPEGEIRALAAETLAVIEDPVFADAFAPGSRSEVPIAAELAELGPGRQIEGRLDRLAVTDCEVLIVDFKTDRAAPDREDDVASRYVTQMALYRAAITKLFPLHRIDCALLWTEEPRLMKLSNERLDAALATVRARLDPRGGTP